MAGFGDIDHALREIANGRSVLVVDDESRENEGDLIFAAEAATPERMAFMVRHTSGYVCVALDAAECDRLDLPPMWHQYGDRQGTAFAVTVDAKLGVTTGISARDRAVTARLLADPCSEAADFTRPGHVVPLRARPGGVLRRPGHTEASVDLARLAGLRPAGVLCEVVSQRDPQGMARRPELAELADRNDLTIITIADLISYRLHTETFVRELARARIPTEFGEFHAIAYRNDADGSEHVAFVLGDVRGAQDVLVRMHSECLTGDVFGSLRCDCGPQFRRSLEAISAAGAGIALYLRGHEGRGIGLAAKLRAYELQDAGADTVDANVALGVPADARDYAVGAAMLRDLSVESVCLLSNNPAKAKGLIEHGVSVTRSLPLVAGVNPENIRYLRTKRDRMGHDLPAGV
ncbi:bifunctional 3,4-dihydroxy-2-butanone-4-phosphate synthase/GTP cyclohydrolase II [Actinokineospora sp. HUAS TT18]|uniref:bifunctional 3,4-dihydroxy-2-butanone-4-phosphate synthase/GTP cyclohydrolase II n=1 Tax=Actinokineospora sp. HUAS TT18 TaxID=3447451 RepID=UPI003F5230CE